MNPEPALPPAQHLEPAISRISNLSFKPSRIDPLNREPTAKSGSTVPFKPFRLDPLNREPMAKTAATAPPARTHASAPRPYFLPSPDLSVRSDTRPANLRLLPRGSRSSLTA
jgi:hypothetical protein